MQWPEQLQRYDCYIIHEALAGPATVLFLMKVKPQALAIVRSFMGGLLAH